LEMRSGELVSSLKVRIDDTFFFFFFISLPDIEVLIDESTNV
jgi:hypothetical protein